jgi:hypothetical protein
MYCRDEFEVLEGLVLEAGVGSPGGLATRLVIKYIYHDLS